MKKRKYLMPEAEAMDLSTACLDGITIIVGSGQTSSPGEAKRHTMMEEPTASLDEDDEDYDDDELYLYHYSLWDE